MRLTIPLLFGLAAATAALFIPHDLWSALAWGFACLTVVLSVVDVLVWQIVKGLDDYATRFQGPSSALEEVLARVWARKKRAFTLFLMNFVGRAYTAAIFGGVTTGKIHAEAHPALFPVAVGVCAFSLPVLAQQIVGFFQVSRELGEQMVRAKREAERAAELARAADRPAPMTGPDEHTSGYVKEATWGNK